MNPDKPSFDGTIDVPVSQHIKIADIPFRVDRGIAEGLIRQSFEGQDPSQETTALRVNRQEEQYNFQEVALWYKNFPTNPRDVVKQYQLMEQHMAYALTELNETIPEAIVKEYQSIAAMIKEYQQAQMELMRSSSPDLDLLKENFFTDNFVTRCNKVLNYMKALGESLYLRLHEQTVQRQRQTFQASPAAQQVREQYSFLANRFETSLDPVEEARRAYEKEVREGIEIDRLQLHMKLKGKDHIRQEYTRDAVCRYIEDKTIAAIHKAVAKGGLSDEATIQLYKELPKAVHSFSAHDNETETASYFKIDQTIHRTPENDEIIRDVLAALVKGLVLTYGAYGKQELNERMLWTYSYALQPGHINFYLSKTSEHNGTVADTMYVRYPKAGNLLTQEGFFKPLEKYDKSFIPDYMALARGNGDLQFIFQQIYNGFSNQQSSKNTAMHMAGAFKLVEKLTANREMLAGYSTQSKPEEITYVNDPDDAKKLNDLRLDSAMAIHALMERIASLEEEKQRQEQNLGNERHLKAEAKEEASKQRQRAQQAESKLKDTREELQGFAAGVMKTCSNINEHAEPFIVRKAEIKKEATALYEKAKSLNPGK